MTQSIYVYRFNILNVVYLFPISFMFLYLLFLIISTNFTLVIYIPCTSLNLTDLDMYLVSSSLSITWN